jgi:hypothetical protein
VAWSAAATRLQMLAQQGLSMGAGLVQVNECPAALRAMCGRIASCVSGLVAPRASLL